jgi:hypothetical protein
MEDQKNPQELQEETVQTPVTEEEVPAAEVQEEKPAEEAAAEQTVEEPTAEPAKKATPGKIAVAVGIVVLLASLLIALVVSGQNKKEEAPVQEETVAEETVEATIPADGNPEDVTCKGSYSISDEEVAATADTVVATIGENTLTNRNLQIYYWMEVQNFLNTYGNYAAYFGMDYTQPLDTQRSTYDENLTWQQFFLDTALTNWHQVQAMKLMAEEAGLQPSAEDQAYLEGLDAYLEQTAAGFGISVEELMAANFGPGADKEGYRYFQDLYLKGLPYYEAESAKMVPTEAELEAYFAEHEEDYAASGVTRDSKFVNVRHILVKLEDGVADENGTVTYSDEEWKACETEAKAILDQWLAGDKSEESFAALATEKTDDGGSMATGGLYEQVYEGQMVPEFNDWCFDESRQHGDYGLVKHSGNNYSGYHVMFFVGSQPQWISYAESDWMNEKSGKLLEDIVAEYPMEVAYENIALGVVQMG